MDLSSEAASEYSQDPKVLLNEPVVNRFLNQFLYPQCCFVAHLPGMDQYLTLGYEVWPLPGGWLYWKVFLCFEAFKAYEC